ncbi:pentatricopeptide repeat-containing protein At2g13600-like [Cryptomeria japonica]|uniref:pentatricopeptide repeat-containing protein At2g13600-like n=1 Tax=Cryptomeria japonica TaxID=3369 RepID=UPI0027DA77C1|nr:pentatricopeptide repeat-containing protein At2g13600-like [Cryptomeria japonica]
MQLAGVKPESTTFAYILAACVKMGALKEGMDIHQSINDRGILSNVVVATALLDMYAKCGSVNKVRELFDKMPRRNMVSWSAMIAGYEQNGFAGEALETFKQMQAAGLVDEGCTYFNHMRDPYCITPTVDHYVCMVDLLARAGYLEDTLNFIIKMPLQPVVVVWMCFLAACRLHMNIDLGVFTAMLLIDVDPKILQLMFFSQTSMQNWAGGVRFKWRWVTSYTGDLGKVVEMALEMKAAGNFPGKFQTFT